MGNPGPRSILVFIFAIWLNIPCCFWLSGHVLNSKNSVDKCIYNVPIGPSSTVFSRSRARMTDLYFSVYTLLMLTQDERP